LDDIRVGVGCICCVGLPRRAVVLKFGDLGLVIGALVGTKGVEQVVVIVVVVVPAAPEPPLLLLLESFGFG